MAGEPIPVDERIAQALERIADALELAQRVETEEVQRCVCGAVLDGNRCTRPQNHSTGYGGG